VSNRLLHDPLLARYLAAELDQRLRGRACAAAPLFMSERVAVLPLDGGEALQLDLHPTRGWIRVLRWEEELEALDAVCTGVESLPDERLLVVRLRAEYSFRTSERRLVVELHTNQWNALLVADEDDRILSALRARSAGERSLRPGQPYRPPPPAGRFGVEEVGVEDARDRWREEIAAAPAEQRRSRLLRTFAWTGALPAEWILGRAGEVEPWTAFQRWWWLRSLPPARPALLRAAKGVHPYPLSLRGMEAEPVDSLLEGMARLAEREPEPPESEELALAERMVARRVRAAERKVARLAEELATSGGAGELRALGDLLLAHLHTVPRGAESVTLPDWEGNPVEIALDPALSPAENAGRWYARARRKERADERIPALLEAARAELSRWEAAATAVRDGIVPEGLG